MVMTNLKCLCLSAGHMSITKPVSGINVCVMLQTQGDVLLKYQEQPWTVLLKYLPFTCVRAVMTQYQPGGHERTYS